MVKSHIRKKQHDEMKLAFKLGMKIWLDLKVVLVNGRIC